MIFVIANPAAGRGKAIRVVREVESARPDERASRILTTEAPGDEARLVREALRNGANTIVVVGGDGTCSKVAQEMLTAGSECALAIIPCGTGNDFAKTLGVAGASPAEIFRLVARGITTRIDVGRADGRYFINSCGFGFDASVLEATQTVRFLKGDALYIYSALAQLLSYRGLDVTIDGARRVQGTKLLMAVASNGRWLGGAFRIAPTASVTDGRLDFCLLADNNVLGRIRIFAGALRGTHLGLPGVTSIKADSLSLTFADRPAMEMDGELQQAISRTVRIECVPKALTVVAGPGVRL
ncbi:MAG: diacylglycerol kinase family protein [Gemmatimonadales bacterium]